MKKYSLALIIMLAFGLVGCGGTSEKNEEIESERTKVNKEKPKTEIINGSEVEGFETEGGGFAAPMK